MLNQTFHVGQFDGLRILAKGHALVSFGVIWAIFCGIGLIWLDLPLSQAIYGSLLVTALHWLNELWHHLSHQQAAKRTGYPMSGIMFVWMLATSLYPRDEPELPGRIHMQRALGGPVGSLLLTLLAGIIFFFVRDTTGLTWYAALFFLLDNGLVFVVGALLPLGFTDGSTIIKYWGK